MAHESTVKTRPLELYRRNTIVAQGGEKANSQSVYVATHGTWISFSTVACIVCMIFIDTLFSECVCLECQVI